MDSVLSIDSLGESELDLLRDKLKQKDQIITEKSEIINSLRQQVTDLNEELQEMENNQQILNQKLDRLGKDVSTKDEELEAVSHALKEVGSAHETLSKRFEKRTCQVQQLCEDLSKTKKELEAVTSENEALKHKNENLTVELEMANSKKRPTKRDSPEPVPALHFPIADEIGEIMGSTSLLPPERFAVGSQEKENHSFTPQQIKQEPIAKSEHRLDANYSSARSDDMRGKQHISQRQPSNHCPNHQKRSQAVENQVFDPIAEYKLRVARANELARRNMQTKPLHQTSYPLELDTFDTAELLRPPQRPPQRPPPKVPAAQVQQRQALSNFTNTPPQPRRVYKKAEAFIV